MSDDEPGVKKTFDEVWGSSEKDVMVEGGEGGGSREGASASSGSARATVAGLPGMAEGEMSLQEISSEDVPFVPGEGSEFQKMAHQTSLSKFDLAPLPAPLKSMAFHLKMPYILAIVSTVFSVCAISLCVICPPWAGHLLLQLQMLYYFFFFFRLSGVEP